MLVSNLQRKSFNPLEKARLIQTLCQPEREGGGGKTREQVGKMFGKTGSWASNCLRMLQLPEVWQHRIAAGELGESQGRLLVPYAEEPEVLEAVAAGMAANPWAWHTREMFERSLQTIVAGESRPAEVADDDAIAKKPATLRRDSQAAEGDAKRAPRVEDLCAVVERFTDVKALRRLQVAVAKRIESLSIRRPK